MSKASALSKAQVRCPVPGHENLHQQMEEYERRSDRVRRARCPERCPTCDAQIVDSPVFGVMCFKCGPIKHDAPQVGKVAPAGCATSADSARERAKSGVGQPSESVPEEQFNLQADAARMEIRPMFMLTTEQREMTFEEVLTGRQTPVDEAGVYKTVNVIKLREAHARALREKEAVVWREAAKIGRANANLGPGYGCYTCGLSASQFEQRAREAREGK